MDEKYAGGDTIQILYYLSVEVYVDNTLETSFGAVQYAIVLLSHLDSSPSSKRIRLTMGGSYAKFVLNAALLLLYTLLLLLAFFVVLCRVRFSRIRGRNEARRGARSARDRVIAFYHPRCSSGGGGERVLWKMIQCLAEMREDSGLPIVVAIYTTDSPEWDDGGGGKDYSARVTARVKERFGIEVSPLLPIEFVHLHEEWDGIAPKGRVSMIAESGNTMRLAWAALHKLTPDIYIDTTGAAFTFLVAKVLAGCKVGAYVHYPTISTDMLRLVWERRPSYNHDADISSSSLKTYAKSLYYIFFAVAYGLVGSLADLVMVNSTWTHDHIRRLWRLAAMTGKIHIVYPPCATSSLVDLPLEEREKIVLSIGQFRPEKDHSLQLRSFARLLSSYPELKGQAGNVQAVFVSSLLGAAATPTTRNALTSFVNWPSCWAYAKALSLS